MASLVVAAASVDDHGATLAIVTGPGDDKIDAFAGLRDVELDCHASIVGDLCVLEDFIHVLE